MNVLAFYSCPEEKLKLIQCLGNYKDNGQHTVQTNITFSGKTAKMYNKVLFRGLPSLYVHSKYCGTYYTGREKGC